MSEWNLPPNDFENFRDHTVLLLADAEHCAIVIAGGHGDAAAELRKIVEGATTDRVKAALRKEGCPPRLLDSFAAQIIGAAAAWMLERDARLMPPAEGTA